MIIGKRYTSKYEFKNYDYIIIGSGISSLALATYLTYLKKSVLVLEQHYTAGGLTHCFGHGDYKWDSGVHYIGEVHDKDSPIYKTFKFLSQGKLKWTFMGESPDITIFGSKKFTTDKRSLMRDFPQESKAIEHYFKLITKIYDSASLYFLSRVLPPTFRDLLSPFTGRLFRKYAPKTLEEVLNTLFKSTELKAVIAAIYGNYGVPPKRAAFVAHAMVAKHYDGGASYPTKGSDQIAKHIVAHLNKLGTDVLVRAKVESILIEENCAKGVILDKGVKVNAKKIISGAGHGVTFSKLIKKDQAIQHLKEPMEPSGGFFCTYLGLDPKRDISTFPKKNIWYYDHERLDESFEAFEKSIKQKLPYLFISFAFNRDNEHQGGPTVTLLTSVEYEHFKDWDHSAWRRRPEDYIKLKKSIEKEMIAKFLEIYPDLRDAIAYQDSSTPLTNKFFSNNQYGEPYGLAAVPKRFLNREIGPRTKIKNLYTTGCDNIMGGVTPALISSVQTLLCLHPFKALHILRLIFKQ